MYHQNFFDIVNKTRKLSCGTQDMLKPTPEAVKHKGARAFSRG
jgi:hypothetical protein